MEISKIAPLFHVLSFPALFIHMISWHPIFVYFLCNARNDVMISYRVMKLTSKQAYSSSRLSMSVVPFKVLILGSCAFCYAAYCLCV